ncbi:MAG: phage tail tape measure protein [Bacteroidales bacterium]
MATTYNRRLTIWINGKEVENNIKSIKGEMNKLVNEQKRMTVGSKEYVAAAKEIKNLNGIIAKHNAELRSSESSWKSLKGAADGFNRYFAMVTAGIATVTGLALSIGSLMSNNSKLSDSMADVAKSTGLSITEVKDLNKELRKIDTRTSREDLLNLAYVAGKLGYSAKNDIIGFVKAADQIGVALSKDLGGNVEDAVNNLGKIADVFKVKDQYGIEDALLKTGSAINSLGAASTANEAYIVDFTKRLGGIAPQAGISVQNVMGLAATLDQLGQQTETSATAVGQLLTKMFAKPGEFAKIAGLNVKDFSSLLKKDANQALILFLQGLQKNKGGLTELAGKFSDLGVDGSRSIGVIGALANNIGILTSSQKLSNVEFEKGTSLTNEFNIKNDNMASNLEKVKRALLSAFVNSSVMDGLDTIVKTMAGWFEIPMSKKLAEERIQVNMLASEMLDANTSAETRNKLYNELKGLAPQVVEGINQENIALDSLRINLEKYNEQMINKIIIQKQQEKIDKANETVAENREDRLKQETEVRKKLAQLYAEASKRDKAAAMDINKINTDPALSILQKAEAVNKFIFDYQKTNNKVLAAPGSLVGNLNMLKIYSEEEAAAQMKVNEALNEKNQLYKDLGLNTKTVATATAANNVKTADEANLTDDTTDSATALKDAFAELSKQITDLDVQINNAIKSRNLPLAQKLLIEKKAAEQLLETYKEVKAQLGKGWDMTKRNKGSIDILTSIGSKGVKSTAKDKDGNPLKMRTTGLEAATPEEAAQAVQDRVVAEEQAVQDRVVAEEQAASELAAQKKEAMFQAATELNDTIFTIVKNRQQAEFDREMSLIEKKRKAELDNKNLTEAQKAAINEKYDKQASALKAKQFKKNQNASMLQAAINGALGITKTFAFYGFTPPGWVAAAAQAAATLMQIAVIKSTPVPEFSQGGYTLSSNSNQTPAGIVHANEYVIPAAGVNNPRLRPFLDTLEMARLNKSLPTLNPAVISSTSAGRFSSGGYTSTHSGNMPTSGSASGSNLSIPDMSAAMHRFADAVEKLQKDGVRGNWSLFDLEKIQRNKSQLESATDM